MPPDLIEYARSRVGTSLGTKYRLERLIGAGGMASVYEAAHRNGLRVAIKVLHPHLSIDADLRARFLREGYVANKVKHRGAVRVLDDDTAADGAVYLVMELLEGDTLDGLLQGRGGRLPLRDVCELADQLLETLTAAHDHQVVHRDIKPENLFLTTDGVLKVLDFGIARLREPGGPQTATRTGRMIGTPAFMPPEQALGRSRQIDGQTDLWAVGATMFTLSSGSFVHEAETMEEMLVCAGSRPARSLQTVLPSAPSPIVHVVDRALAFSKEQRWPDARAMRAALGAAYREVYGGALQVRSSHQPAIEPSAPAIDDPALAPRGAPLSPAVNRLSTTAGVAGATGSVSGESRPTAVHSRRAGYGIALPVSVLVLTGGGMALRALHSPATSSVAPPPSDTSTAAAARSVPVLDPAAPPALAEAPHPEAPQASSPARTGMVPSKPEVPTAPAAVARHAAVLGPLTSSLASPSVTPKSAASSPVASSIPSPPVPTPVATAPAPPPPVHEATPPPPAVPSCQIVTSYDGNGQPHFKKVCN